MSDQPRMGPLPESDWDDLLRGVLSAAPGGQERPVNVFTTLARHPKLFRDWIRLGGRLLGGSSFSARERELAILRTAHNCGSEYEWAQHVKIGLEAGLDRDEIEAVGRGHAARGTVPYLAEDQALHLSSAILYLPQFANAA